MNRTIFFRSYPLTADEHTRHRVYRVKRLMCDNELRGGIQIQSAGLPEETAVDDDSLSEPARDLDVVGGVSNRFAFLVHDPNFDK